VSGFYCDVKPNICMKKDQKVVQRPVPDAYEFSPIPDSKKGRLVPRIGREWKISWLTKK
jgi:hypothetical protein